MATKTTQKAKQPENFLEALRELGRDIATETRVQITKAVTTDLPDAFGVTHTSGTLKPNEQFSVQSQSSESSRKNSDTYFNNHFAQNREQEQARFRQNQAEIKQQIASIQTEIRSLAKAAGELASEVQVATLQATVDPGLYHKHFFARLKSTISLLRKRVSESRNWLAEVNSRSKKKGHYWSQVQKSGTSYMLSSERYAVTSTG